MNEPAITAFFLERKEAWLKKNLKPAMSADVKRQVEKECDDTFSLSNWLPNAATRAGQISLSTHPCTYSHPSARKNKNGYVTSVLAEADYSPDGFIRQGNVQTEPDALGNAAALDVYKFLTLEMSDGQTLIAHIQKETDLALTLLAQSSESKETLRSGFLAMARTEQESVTSSKIKQVYFPVEDDYHLLSVLTNSPVLYELRKRIDHMRFSEETKAQRELKKQGKYSDQGFSELYNLTTIGYGGTKPQNISVLNSQNGGKAHLLLCAPPTLTNQSIRIPKRDFFIETLNPWYLKETFDAFHRLVVTDYNNLNIREGRDFRIQEYIDHVIQLMWQLRGALTDHQSSLPADLKKHQKIWLYPEFEQERHASDDWLEKISDDLTHSFITGYKKVLKQKAELLGDNLYHAVKDVVATNKEGLR